MRTHRHLWRILAGSTLALALVAITALPAAAGNGIGDRTGHNRRIAVGDITVTSGEVVDGPMIGVDGDARIAGRVDGTTIVLRGDVVVTADGVVDGDVVVARGDATILGTVDGNVVVIGGRAFVGANAVVHGDVRSTDAPRVQRGARVTGEVQDVDVAGIIAALGAGILLFWWIAVTLSTALLGVLVLALVPRALDASAAVGRDPKRWWQALLVGLGLVVGLPVVGVAAVSTVLGLPFGLGLLGATGLIHALGYVAGAYFLGRLILREPTNRFGAFFVGWGILRVLAIIPLFGMLVWFAAALYGLGMLAVAAFRAGQAPHATPTTTRPEVTP
ncbi:MAG: polymer-forming cytoskeletal protein [Acidimicrobiia bacterium]|jgi:cytoskeletal protein CcmA (bactofilin family)